MQSTVVWPPSGSINHCKNLCVTGKGSHGMGMKVSKAATRNGNELGLQGDVAVNHAAWTTHTGSGESGDVLA